MTNTAAEDGGAAAAQGIDGVVKEMTGVLDQWKARVDQLKVQADLAKLDVRGKAEKQVEIAQNACLAAYSRLREAGPDATESAQALRQSVEKLLGDVKRAFEAAQAVITRG